MPKYFCPECAHESDEPICPVCGSVAETLEVDDVKGVPLEEEKYPGDVEDYEDRIEDEDMEEVEETNEKNKEL